MEKQIKELYEAPSATALEVKYEGVICASGKLQNYYWQNEDEE